MATVGAVGGAAAGGAAGVRYGGPSLGRSARPLNGFNRFKPNSAIRPAACRHRLAHRGADVLAIEQLAAARRRSLRGIAAAPRRRRGVEIDEILLDEPLQPVVHGRPQG